VDVLWKSGRDACRFAFHGVDFSQPERIPKGILTGAARCEINRQRETLSMVQPQLYFFGPPRVMHGSETVAVGRRKGLALLAYVTVTGRAHSREALATLLWPDFDQGRALSNLRRELSRLKQDTGRDLIVADRQQVAPIPEGELWVDVGRFNALLDAADEHNHFPAEACPDCLNALVEAAALQADDFMAGFTLPDAPVFDEWQFFEREGLRRRLAEALQKLIEWHRDRGEVEAAVSCGRRWLALDTLHEPAHRTLMALYALDGHQAAAARQYEECRRLLEEELGVEPEPETVDLYEAIRSRRFGPRPAAAGDDGVAEEWFGEELRRAQAAGDEAAVLRAWRRLGQEQLEAAQSQSGAGPGRLPVPPMPFVGRRRELAELRRLLLAEAHGPLVTLTGPGGIGKTRLALEAAGQNRDSFADGVYFVPLAQISSPDQVIPSIAEHVGLQFFGQDRPGRQLFDYLRDKQALLVIDNFEHVIEGARVVADILHMAPAVRILATSREALNVSGEVVFPVRGLPVGGSPGDGSPAQEPAAAGHNEAVELLLQQVRRARPGFQAGRQELAQAMRIVRLVEGMPLALVLAGAWLELLSLGEVADEIARSLSFLENTARDVPERQHSMRATFDYSWQRLAETEQQAFMKLSVFQASFNRQAAQVVAGADLATLRRLVNKSFLSVGEDGRFEIHPLLRQYGWEYLVDSGEQRPAQAAHSRYFLGAVRQLEGDLEGGRQFEALAEFEADLENVRAAWEWAVAAEEEALLLDSCRSLHLAFHVSGRYHEEVQLLQPAGSRFAPQPDGSPPRPIWRALVPCVAYSAAYSGIAVPQMKREAEYCLELAEEEGDDDQAANCLLALSCFALFVEQEPGRAIPLLTRSSDLFHQLGRPFAQQLTLAWLGWAYGQNGDAERFRTISRQALELAVAAGNLMAASAVRHNLGILAITAGEYAEAEEFCYEALESAAAAGRLQSLALAQLHLALLHFLRGDVAGARGWADKGLAIGERINVTVTKSYAYSVLGLCAAVEGDTWLAGEFCEKNRNLSLAYYYGILSDWAAAVCYSSLANERICAEHLAVALGQALKSRLAAVMAWLMPAAALLEARAGRPERAVELLALAEDHPLSAPGWIEQWGLMADLQAHLRQVLGEEGYRQAWQQGRELDLEATAAAVQVAATAVAAAGESAAWAG
jgi:predicted ATPase/DNA-binding SARP family transcriptional activator